MKNYIQIKRRYLFFREDAKNLGEYIYRKNKGNESRIIFLDFSCVDFMSRSFIDEFLNVLNELKMKGIKVRLTHLKSDLMEFISHVKKTKNIIQNTLTLENLRE